MNQDGPYKFYDVVAVEEIDTVYTGNAYDFADTGTEPEQVPQTAEERQADNPNKYSVEYHTNNPNEKLPEHFGYKIVWLNKKGDEIPENGNTQGTYFDKRPREEFPDMAGF
jgi:hypothetical protein